MRRRAEAVLVAVLDAVRDGDRMSLVHSKLFDDEAMPDIRSFLELIMSGSDGETKSQAARVIEALDEPIELDESY